MTLIPTWWYIILILLALPTSLLALCLIVAAIINLFKTVFRRRNRCGFEAPDKIEKDDE